MPRFSFKPKQKSLELPDELRVGFQLKIEEYRSRLKIVTNKDPRITPTGHADDGIVLTRNEDEVHSLYKMEIMKRLLRDGKLGYAEAEAQISQMSAILPFSEGIFRSAYNIILGYCRGKHELPQTNKERAS